VTSSPTGCAANTEIFFRFSRREALYLLAQAATLFVPGIASRSARADDAKTPTTSISEGIVAGFSDAAQGAAYSYVLGQVLSVAGIDADGQGALNAKLDQILDALQTLTNDVTQLRSDMDTQLNQMQYDDLLGRVEPLIENNQIMHDWYRAIGKASNVGDLNNAKSNLTRAIANANLEQAVLTWHNTLCGLSGKRGLIQTWNKAVRMRNPLFGPSASAAIEKNWRRFDSEQSRTWLFLIESLNANPSNRQYIPDRLKRWRTYRKQQLALLRGMNTPKDAPFHYADDNNTHQSETVSVKYLPANVAVDIATGRMWRLTIDRSNPRRDFSADFDNDVYGPNGILAAQNKLTKCTPEGNCPGWALPSIDEFLSLINLVGGHINPDQFTAQMQNKGFVFSNLPSNWNNEMHIWTREIGNYDDGQRNNRFRILMNENYHSTPATQAGDHGMLLFQRTLLPNESNDYYYLDS
jgi:hypothetical protein